MRILVIIFLTFALINCNIKNSKQPLEVCLNINVTQRIEDIPFYDKSDILSLHGKFVKIKGIFRYDFEDVALYPSASAEFSKALWVDLKLINSSNDRVIERLKDKAVYVIGKVDTLKKGHLNGYLAELDSVFCIKEVTINR